MMPAGSSQEFELGTAIAAGRAIAVGAAAPDFHYADEAGRQARLSEHWTDQPVLVLWLRHFG